MSVLVTGGTGKTGRRLAARLADLGQAVRIAARHPPAGPQGRRLDWSDRDSWDSALEGVSGLYLVPSSVAAEITAMIEFMGLALDRGVRRFVLLSASLLPAGGPGAGLAHQWLRDNAAEWAVLRPSWFMQNFSEGPHRETIRAEDRIYTAAGDGKVAFISADDIAGAACAALTAPRAINTDVILTGPEAISYDTAAAMIGQAIGRAIIHVRLSVDDLAARHRDRGLPPATAQILAGMDTLIAGGAEDRVTTGVETLTGEPPTPFDRFCRQNAQAWRRA
ncbi:MAG: ergot alkaloid biosynthesis protein [Caulobacteraceae bacterium]|nr:ergot alkaloid biosynthesis protein [Caulobacteraceae bacterium]